MKGVSEWWTIEKKEIKAYMVEFPMHKFNYKNDTLKLINFFSFSSSL